MIAITGAGGKTGKAVLKALIKRGETVRTLVYSQEKADELIDMGAIEAVIGDMTDLESYRMLFDGVESVYHICPNVHPEELEIGRLSIRAAIEAGLHHFVYHSVLHPQTEKMPHHWLKLRVEEMLLESGLPFTIMQPAPYMQNLLAEKNRIISEGVYRAPYPPETRYSMIDLVDLGEAAALVITEPGHAGSTYELVGVKALAQKDLAYLLEQALGYDVRYQEVSIDEWKEEAEGAGMGRYQVDTLITMFQYYARFGLNGSNFLLKRLLRRKPGSFSDFIYREFLGYR